MRTSNPTPLHILHIITSLSNGGAQEMLYKLISSSPIYMTHTVVCLLPEDVISKKIKALNIPIYHLNFSSFFSFFRLFSLYKIIKKHKPNFIQSWLYHADLISFFIGKVTGTPTFWNIRSSASFLTASLSLKLIIRINAYLSQFVPKIIINSRAGIEIHKKIGFNTKNMVFIPNGFNLKEFSTLPNTSLHKSLNISNDTPILLFLGRYNPIKGLSFLIEAFSNFQNRFKIPLHLVMAGENLDSSNNQLLLTFKTFNISSSSYSLLGYHKNPASILNSCSILTLPSLSEGFHNELGEALACGKFCVASDVGDCKDILQSFGTIVPPKNSNALSSAWHDYLIKSKSFKENLSVDARKSIKNRFDISIIVNQYYQTYLSYL